MMRCAAERRLCMQSQMKIRDDKNEGPTRTSLKSTPPNLISSCAFSSQPQRQAKKSISCLSIRASSAALFAFSTVIATSLFEQCLAIRLAAVRPSPSLSPITAGTSFSTLPTSSDPLSCRTINVHAVSFCGPLPATASSPFIAASNDLCSSGCPPNSRILSTIAKMLKSPVSETSASCSIERPLWVLHSNRRLESRLRNPSTARRSARRAAAGPP